jgi:hypothetical protein
MSTPIFCLALRPLHDTALRQTLLVDPQPMKRLEAANPATLRDGSLSSKPMRLRPAGMLLVSIPAGHILIRGRSF